jgi:hypothetical protein
MRMTHAACRHLVAAAILGAGLGFSSSAHAADCPQLRITKEVFAPNVADLAAAVRAAVGPTAERGAGLLREIRAALFPTDRRGHDRPRQQEKSAE